MSAPCLRHGSDGAKYLLYYPVGRTIQRPAGFAFLDGLLAKLGFRTGAPVFLDSQSPHVQAIIK